MTVNVGVIGTGARAAVVRDKPIAGALGIRYEDPELGQTA